MNISQLNYNEFYFHLQNLISDEDKLNYLYKLKFELRKATNSFEDAIQLPLRMFLEDCFQINDEYQTLHTFLKNVIGKQSLNPRDKRFPGEDFLRQEIRKELVELTKLESLVDSEIEFLKSSSGEFNFFSTQI
ncbi:MAG: hypothetical protein CO129_08640 [Ignavibacteriales bacterium CG_4_9_14_3_um_filter_34_10]|nr:MAG: hypothetical protein CO129_08640 [Ignavibacteriales bacterium CG_4_9_14_3_um_filter_34_10]